MERTNTDQKNFFSVVIPAFNETEALSTTVESVLQNLSDRAHELIIVDDGSTDTTWNLINELATRHPTVRGVRFARNFGHQAALLAGLGTAKGQAVVMLDSDGQHPPEFIPIMIKEWEQGAIIVQGIRQDANQGSFLKRFTSRTYYRLFSWLAGTNISPGSADFRLMDRKAVDLILTHPRSAMFLRGFIPWSGFKTVALEFRPKERMAGETKYSLRKMFGLAREGLMRFSVKPLRLATLLGSFTCFVSLCYLIYILYTRVFSGEYVAGWASVAGLLSLLGGLQLLIMGILGEYIGMIFEAQLARPPFVISERVENRAPPSGAHAMTVLPNEKVTK
jgi:dolichol-phosphate mannosyltransferase